MELVTGTHARYVAVRIMLRDCCAMFAVTARTRGARYAARVVGQGLGGLSVTPRLESTSGGVSWFDDE